MIFTPDGRRLLGINDRVLRLWDVDSGREVTQIGGNWGWAPLALARDGNFALTATADHRVRLLRLSTGALPAAQVRLRAMLKGHTSTVGPTGPRRPSAGKTAS